MANFNKVILMGNLTKDPELRYTPSGTATTTLRLAINNKYKTKSGDLKEDVLYMSVVVWAKSAENCVKYLKKGSPVFVEGKLQSRDYEKDGIKRIVVEVKADKVQFLNKFSTQEEPVDLGI